MTGRTGRTAARCPVCAGPRDPQRLVCAACRKKIESCTLHNPLLLEGCVLFRAGRYAEPFRSLHLRFKYGRETHLAGLISTLMLQCWLGRVSSRSMPDLVCPVPSTWVRCGMRGFNPAALLAARIASDCGIPMSNLMRRRNGPKQTGLPHALRVRNVSGAFRVRPGVWRRRVPVAKPRILLVDDVCTTGATLCEAARALRKGGASEVSCLCFLARR